ncbi:tetratricopeptide repeat protein [Streptomyces gamaensis]|uniref:Tetratricopeptide repeat protein n=1 Tax=Streptomyces gamaensis TaxID=1763542 RepID=A0ABW0Z0I8_9ACTN
MGAARMSMQELIRRRRRAGFVGRRDELAVFQENFDCPPEDERHRFVFHIHGDAGVGKTSLVREMESVARERGAVTAYIDESVNSVPEALSVICDHFAQQDVPLKPLEKLLARYRERRHEAESAAQEPGDESGGPSPGATVIAQAGLAGLGMVPGLGPVAGALDASSVARTTDRLRGLLSARFGKQEDVQLVLDPLRALTPALAEELAEAAEEVPWLAIFFDTYERTAPFLDSWLRDLVTTERYGALPANTVITLAGQRRPDPACWADSADLVKELPLDLFTEAEVRQLLAAKGVVEEGVVRDILRLSGRLPVLVSTLAENPGDVAAPSATAVDRFLKWEQDPARRATALACALPRRLDEDICRAATGATDEDGEQFGWLRSLPFVSERDGLVRYHDVVRTAMLAMQRASGPQRWEQRHRELAAAFSERRAAADQGQTGERPWSLPEWREERLDELYHLLCARPRAELGAALLDGVHACDESLEIARRWARVLAEAGEDADSELLRGWGDDCLGALSDEQSDCARLLSLLINRAGFNDAERAHAHVIRGRELRETGSLQEALGDYDQAIALDPANARAYFGRGVTYLRLQDFEQALADLDKAHELEPEDADYLTARGEARSRSGHSSEALADYSQAVGLDPGNRLALVLRGLLLRDMGQYRRALADLDRVMDLEPGDWWTLVSRSWLRQVLDDPAGALDDLQRAALMEDSAWVQSELGDLHRFAGRYDEALAAYDKALAFGTRSAWMVSFRARILADLGRTEDALDKQARAYELNPQYFWALRRRILLNERLGRLEHALTDCDRLLTADPDDVWNLRTRARLLVGSGDGEAALQSIERAVALGPEDLDVLSQRLDTLEFLGKLHEACATIEQLLEVRSDDPFHLFERAWIRAQSGEVEGELADLDAAVAAAPGNLGFLFHRGESYRRRGWYERALTDFDHIIAAEPRSGVEIGSRGQVLRAVGRHEEALADVNWALQLVGEQSWLRGERAATLLALRRPQEARADLTRAIRLDADFGWARGRRALALLDSGHLAEAAAQLDTCLGLMFGDTWTAAWMSPDESAESLARRAPACRCAGWFTMARTLAERLRAVDRDRGTFHLAMAVSRAKGPAAAAALWRELYPSPIAAAALGEWSLVDRHVAPLLDSGCAWTRKAETAESLEELALCPGTDVPRLRGLADSLWKAVCPITLP